MALTLATGATLFWASTNLIDKYLVSRVAAERDLWSLVTLSALFPSVLLPVCLVMTGGRLAMPAGAVALLVASGLCQIGWIAFYLRALRIADASIVMTIMLTAPFFAGGFGAILLAERPALMQAGLCLLILSGAGLLLFDAAGMRINWRLAGLILAAASLVALANALFKAGAGSEGYWKPVFWQASGSVLAGLTSLATRLRVSRQAFPPVRRAALLGVNEALTLCGNLLFNKAVLLAPLAVVQTSDAFQAVFVFAFGVATARFLPGTIEEALSARDLARKTTGIGIVCGSTIALCLLG